MMSNNKIIAYTDKDGKVAFIRPTPEYVAIKQEENPKRNIDQILRNIADDKVPTLQRTTIRLVRPEDIPSTTDYKECWVLTTDSKVVVSVSKAKEAKLEDIRSTRTNYLRALDVEYMKADESDDHNKKQYIAGLKTKLRDCTKDPAIAELKTVEDIQNYTPDIFNVLNRILG